MPRVTRFGEHPEVVTPIPEIARTLWLGLGGDPSAVDDLDVHGDRRVLPSGFDVTGFATAAVAVANLAAAEVAQQRGAPRPAVRVGTREACAAFRSEALLTAEGWELPPVWDPIAGDYRCADGWIRLHTNYERHRAAALHALDLPPDADRDAVAAAVASRPGEALERAVVDEGGCAAVMHDRDAWRRHPHGRVAVDEPWARVTRHEAPASALGPMSAPLTGVRVLDLTRVIAGPVCTRFLAAQGADVLRIDPPGFAEVPALVPDTTVGKRCAALDLRTRAGRELFDDLVRAAHVVVHGLRPGALDALGLGAEHLRSVNPTIIDAGLDAYGWEGPWADRRGFDSLVQMSTGICAAGAAAAGTDRPTPLPAQALDHGTGYVLAAAVCRALASSLAGGGAATIRASLVGAANVLWSLPDPDALKIPAPTWDDVDTERHDSPWGPLRVVSCPGTIGSRRGEWRIDPGPLGRDPAQFG